MMFAENADEPDASRKPSDATESADVASLVDSMNVQQKACFAAMLLSPMPDRSYCGLIMFRPLDDEMRDWTRRPPKKALLYVLGSALQ
jgi:hypothetical protein